jgi:hypothetical protein
MSGMRTVASWGRVSRFVTAGALATALVACGGSSGGSGHGATGGSGGSGSTSVLQGDPTVVVAGSAQRTTAAKSAKVALTGTVAEAGQAIDLNGTGAINFEQKTFQLSITIPSMGQIDEVFIDNVIYIKVPSSAAGQFGGKPWLKIDPKAFTGAGANANPFGSLDSSNPSQILSTLQGAGNVTKVGDEDVRGTHTVHYRADIDIAKAADMQKLTPEQKQLLQKSLGGQATLPEDVWLDDQGLVRRLAIDINATPPTAGSSEAPTSIKTKVQMEFYDYGQPTPMVTAPPADQVTDFGQILGQLGSLGGGTGKTS